MRKKKIVITVVSGVSSLVSAPTSAAVVLDVAVVQDSGDGNKETYPQN